MNQKKRGRPGRTPKQGERVPLGLRVTADLKRALDRAATLSGRSQSQEAELRLERSLYDEKLLETILRDFAVALAERWERPRRDDMTTWKE